MATTTDHAIRMHRPAHPGSILRQLYLEPLGVSVTSAAKALDVSRKHLSDVVNGKVSITPDMANRLAVALRTYPEVWLSLQSQYDVWEMQTKPRPKVRPLVEAVAC